VNRPIEKSQLLSKQCKVEYKSAALHETIMILFTGGKLGQQSALKLENEPIYA
jgi:hypothetical protein